MQGPGTHLAEQYKGIVQVSSDVIGLLIDGTHDLFLCFQAFTDVIKYLLNTFLKILRNWIDHDLARYVAVPDLTYFAQLFLLIGL